MLFKLLFPLSLISLITACGGGDISSDNSSIGSQGATPFAGTWTLNANISVNAAGTASAITQTSTVSVNANGAAAISTTNTDCSVSVNFNGSQINYQTTCLVSNGTTGGAACTLTFTGFAAIVGSSASGSINPQTVLCNNAAASFTGNITGAKI
jgi:hypothetical protein